MRWPSVRQRPRAPGPGHGHVRECRLGGCNSGAGARPRKARCGHSNIALSLINDRKFDEAIAILAAQDNADVQAQGLITLARTVEGSPYAAFGDVAWAKVLELVEGPEWVPVSAYTISRLAELPELEPGALRDRRERACGIWMTPISNSAGVSPTSDLPPARGPREEYATYLRIANDGVAQIEDPANLAQMTRNLIVQLVYAERFDDALRIARDVTDPQMRITVLETLVTALSGFAIPAVAMDAADAITDPVARQTQKRMVLLSALRRSLGV